MMMKTFLQYNILIVVLILTASCSDTVNDNGQSADELELSGTVENYSGNAYNLRAAIRFDDLGEGEINEDGSFEATLWSGDIIDDALEPIGESLEDYRPFPCIGEDGFEISDANARFAHVTDFVYGPEGNSLALTDQTEGFVNRNYPRIEFGEIRVMWIYADRAVQIEGECERQRGNELDESMVNLNLGEGWNEIIYDHRDRNDLRVTQGARPASVGWYTDYGLVR